ncbi:helix-turn-helix domain-containing protein [Vibrio mediterranei]
MSVQVTNKVLNNGMKWHLLSPIVPSGCYNIPPTVSLKDPSQLFVEERKNHGDFVLHQHEFIEIFIVLEGHAIHYLGEKQHVITAGDFVLVDKKTLHGFERTSNLHLINISFSEEHWHDDNKIVQGLVHDLRSHYQDKKSISVNWSHLQKIRRVIQSLIDNCNITNKNRYIKQLDYIYLAEIFALIADATTSTQTISPLTIHDRCLQLVVKARDLKNELDIKAFIRDAGESYQPFIKYFRYLTGTTPTKLKTAIIMNEAKNQLRLGYYSVADVAEYVGFSDFSYFSKCFKAYHGHCPQSTDEFPVAVFERQRAKK